jgi:hypothetical protein
LRLCPCHGWNGCKKALTSPHGPTSLILEDKH